MADDEGLLLGEIEERGLDGPQAGVRVVEAGVGLVEAGVGQVDARAELGAVVTSSSRICFRIWMVRLSGSAMAPPTG